MTINPDDDVFRQDINAWPARPEIWDPISAVMTRSFDVDEPPLCLRLLDPHDRRKALHDRRDSCHNRGRTRHSVRHREEPFNNAHQVVKPDLSQLNDNVEAFRRWQQRMIQYRSQAYTRQGSRSPPN